MLEDVYKDLTARMDKTIETAVRELGKIRTGRATPALLEGMFVDAYGSKMPLNQVATISVPQPRVLKLQPFDKANMGAIERAIMTSDLGITPRSDGHSVIVEIPTLSEERREELAKLVHKRGEEMKVAIRNVRRDGNDELKMLEEEKEISEDDLDRGLKKVQELTDKFIEKVDELIAKKDKEIMEF
jgi:ribosome recycling factor